MNKFVKLTISAIVALLVVGAISSVQGFEARAAKPEVVNLAVRSKGLPPIVARQEYTSSPETPSATPETPSTTPAKSADATPTGLPTDLIPKASPSGPVDTGAKATTTPSATAPAYVPSGTGSLIPQWSSLIDSAPLPSGQPSSPPSLGAGPKSTTTPAASAANKIENGLMGVIIVGIVGSFF